MVSGLGLEERSSYSRVQLGTVAAYIRVSSRSQNHAYQRAAIERAALARGVAIEEWFAERESAGRLARPELDRLRQAAREGLVSSVWVWRIDRLTRSGIRDTIEVIGELRDHGAPVVTVADPFSLENELVLAIFAWCAQMDRQKIRENQAAARQRLEASGGSWGRPRRVSPELEQRIRTLHAANDGAAEKMTIRAIAQKCGVPRSTVAAVLSGKGPYSRRAAGAQNTR